MTNSFRGKFPEMPNVRARGQKAVTAATGSTQAKSFPVDLGAHYILFTFYDYTFTVNAPPTRASRGSIALPPPQSMMEKHTIDYNNSELGVIGGQLTEIGLEAVRGLTATDASEFGDLGVVRSVESVFGDIISNAEGKLADFQSASLADKMAVASAPLRQGNNALAAGLNMAFGNAPNPHITAVFRSVQLNSHNFAWQLSPRSADESYKLANIIAEFKRAALPKFGGPRGFAGALLTFPKVCSINLLGSVSPKFQTEYKDCVIKNINAEYAPNGPSFFAGTGAPTHINLSLGVQEIQIHTADDHEESADVMSPANFDIIDFQGEGMAATDAPQGRHGHDDREPRFGEQAFTGRPAPPVGSTTGGGVVFRGIPGKTG